MTDSKFAGLAEFRCIGPFRGGRVVAVAGDPRDMNTFYFGGVCGGVWKTTDAGQYWENISGRLFHVVFDWRAGSGAGRPQRHLRRHWRDHHPH